MGTAKDVTILAGMFVQQLAQWEKCRRADEMESTNYFNFLEERNWNHNFDLHKSENYLDSRKFKIIIGYWAKKEKKIGCAFNIWLLYAVKLIEVVSWGRGIILIM